MGERLENRSVSEWSAFKKRRGKAPKNGLLTTTPTHSVFTAASTMCNLFIHRLPIVNDLDGTSLITIINHQRILRFLMARVEQEEKSSLLSFPLSAIPNCGWYDDLLTCKKHSSILEVLRILSNNRIPGVPVLAEDGTLWDCFARSDIRFLAMEKAYLNIDISVEEFISKTRKTPTVQMSYSLYEVFTTMLANRRHLCIVVD